MSHPSGRGWIIPIGSFILLSSSPALPEEPQKWDPAERMSAYLWEATHEIEAAFLQGIESRADWEARRPQLQRQYLEMLGLQPLPERTPLEPQITGTLEREAFTVEKLHFQSRPGLYVTGNLYLPRRLEGKLPAVLYVCGHSGRGRDGNKTAFQHHGMWFASNGIVCLIIDTLQLGEIAGIHHGTYRHDRWWWHSRGYTPAGVECWNGIRAIDYLQSRPEVDPERIAVTGISGGGASSFWIAAADDRVKVAVPVSGMSDLDTYVNDRVVNGHCDCMFLYNAHRWPWAMIAALVAPRPLMFQNSDSDTIFPMPGNHRLITDLRRLYGLLGAPGNLGEVVVPGGHSDKQSLRQLAYQWIRRFLLNDNSEVSEGTLLPFKGEELRVFPDAFPADAINASVDEVFVPAANLDPPAGKPEIDSLRERFISELKRLSLGPPERSYPVKGFPRRRAAGSPSGTLWLLVLNPEDDAADLAWAQKMIGGTIIPFAPRGVGENAFEEKAPWEVRRSLALLGRTLDGGRVWDVARAAELLRRDLGGEGVLGVAGRGQAGVIGAYAALLGDAIGEAAVIAPPASHRDGPHLLNILRIGDIPDALGLLAPRKLRLIGAPDRLAEKVRRYYEAAGAGGSLGLANPAPGSR